MDKLFGIPTQQLTLTLLGAFAAVTLILGVLAMRDRTSLRMAVRNLSRRRTQTVLIVAGLTLATVLFSAAFTTGDTLTNSLRAQALEDIGQVDVVVRAEQPASGSGAAFGPGTAAGSAVPEPRETYFGERLADEIEDRLASNGNVAGVAPLAKESVPVTSPETDLSEPRVDVLGVDGRSMGGFDPLRTASGEALAPGDLGKGEVYVSLETAEGLGVGRGDEVEAFLVRDFGQPAEDGRPSVPGSGRRTEAPRSSDAGPETGMPPAGGRTSGFPPSMPKGASGPGESKPPSRSSGPAAEQTPPKLEVVGVYDSGANPASDTSMVMPLKELQEFVGEEGKVNEVLVTHGGPAVPHGSTRPRPCATSRERENGGQVRGAWCEGGTSIIS